MIGDSRDNVSAREGSNGDHSPRFDRSGYDLPLDGGGFPNGGSKGDILDFDVHGGAREQSYRSSCRCGGACAISDGDDF